MKRTLLTLLIIISSGAIAQKVFIPYRAGKLWGLSDTLGKIIIQPVYDDVYFPQENPYTEVKDFPPGYHYAIKNGKQGMLHGKEIIKPVYTEVHCMERSYFAAYKGERTEPVYFTLEGKPLMPAGYRPEKAIWHDGLYGIVWSEPARILFLFDDIKGKKGLYCYNKLMSSQSMILLRDYESITIEESESDDLVVKVKKTGGTYKFLKIGYNQERQNIAILQTSATDQFPEPAPYYDDVALVDYNDELPMAEAYGNKVTVKELIAFSVSGNTVSAIVNGHNPGEPDPEIMQLPADATEITIHPYKGISNNRFTSRDTTRIHTAYITYRQKGKLGLVCSEKIIPAQFDSLLQIVDLQQQHPKSAIRFIFGSRDASGLMKFGLLNEEGIIIFPALYDSIYWLGNGRTKLENFASEKWTVTLNGKLGIITPENKVILDIKYDGISKRGENLSSRNPLFKLLKKDNLYGVYYYENDGIYSPAAGPFLIEPFTKHFIKTMIFAPKTEAVNRNYYILMLLVDEQGNKVGYANRNGLLYFKD